MELDYKEYAKRENSYFPISIHTEVGKNMRVSSIYRRFSNSFFESWGWETLLWNNERIENEYLVLDSAEEVVNLHATILTILSEND